MGDNINTREWKVLCGMLEARIQIENGIQLEIRLWKDLQETKREHFDHQFLKNFCPLMYYKFEYLPSVGTSGGVITI